MGNPLTQLLRFLGRAVATIVVLVWLTFEFVLWPLVRPVVSWFGTLAVFKRLGALIGRLPPYAVLVVLAIPFVLVEPLKAIGLYWIATGLFWRGVALFVFSHLVSLLTLDRIYHAGRGQLMKIGWFARLMGWIVKLRDRAFGIVKSTAAWKWASRTAIALRSWGNRLIRSIAKP